MTADETTEYKATAKAAQASAADREAATAASVAAKTSAHTKLAALGLTADEIAAL